jgi:hypothetical protein
LSEVITASASVVGDGASLGDQSGTHELHKGSILEYLALGDFTSELGLSDQMIALIPEAEGYVMLGRLEGLRHNLDDICETLPSKLWPLLSRLGAAGSYSIGIYTSWNLST